MKDTELYVAIPVDMDAVKSKVMFNLTKRQMICFGIGIMLGAAVYFSVKNYIGTSAAGLLMMAIMIPAFFLAIYEKNGETLDVMARHRIAMQRRPAIRIYRSGDEQIECIGNHNLSKKPDTSKSERETIHERPGNAPHRKNVGRRNLPLPQVEKRRR